VGPLSPRSRVSPLATTLVSRRVVVLQESWRRPRGIDNRCRRRFKGNVPLVNIGYGSNKKTRNVLPNGLKTLRVSNVADLEVLLMHNRTFAAEINHNVSSRQRKEIVARASALRITVTNALARLDTEEAE
jgi:ribosomal protein L32E